jgi:hypothetical protein
MRPLHTQVEAVSCAAQEANGACFHTSLAKALLPTGFPEALANGWATLGTLDSTTVAITSYILHSGYEQGSLSTKRLTMVSRRPV